MVVDTLGKTIAQPAADDGDVPAELTLPILPLPGMVLMPHMMAAIKVSDTRALAAVAAAEAGERLIVVAPGPEAANQDEEHSHVAVYRQDGTPELAGNLGVVARIEQTSTSDNVRHVALQGLYRFEIESLRLEGEVTVACGEPRPDATDVAKDENVAQTMEKCLVLIEQIVELMPGLPDGVMDFVRDIDHPGELADQTGYFPEYRFEERLAILSELDPVARLSVVVNTLKKHVARLQLRADVMAEVKDELDNSQREVFLREQLRVIRRELGDDEGESWLDELRERLEQAQLPEVAQKKAARELARLSRLGPHSPESAVAQTYLEWLADLPWANETDDNTDLAGAAKMLDADHYGLKQVKERILEYLAVRQLAGEKMKTPILCFVGPPGVGKTSLGRSIARVLGRKFVRISLGGMHDEAEIRGHRRTYIGALPGRIIQGMRDAGSRNPVFMLDEIDKVGRDFRGDPAAALLEALDPEQNGSFSDHYLEVPFDLSHTIFITTANLLDPIPPALRDRMEVIQIPGYTEEEKLAIGQRYLVPKQLAAHGLSDYDVVWRNDVLVRLVREYTREAGVRGLEREIAAIARKVARQVVEKQGKRQKRRYIIRGKDVERYLGPPRYEFGKREVSDQVGIATGVAVTEAGGEVLPIEVSIVEGTGKLLLTGQLGQVMQESAQAALTYARSRLGDLGVAGIPLDKRDVHIHVPAGAVPKDGPSAGIAMATALLSALSGRAVRSDVAMTGEVTLRGRVLPIGGLKEKVLAAKAAGITHFILPAVNQKDIPELSPSARKGMDLIPVEHMDEVLGVALLPHSVTPVTASAGQRS